MLEFTTTLIYNGGIKQTKIEEKKQERTEQHIEIIIYSRVA